MKTKTKTKTKTEKHGNYLVSSPLFLHKRKVQFDSRTWQLSIFRPKNCSRSYGSSLLHSQFFPTLPPLPSPPLPFPLSKLPPLWKPSNHVHRFRRKKSSNDWILASAKAMDIEVDEDLYLFRWDNSYIYMHILRSCVLSHGLGLTRLPASTSVLGGLGLNAFIVRNISTERAELVFWNFTVLKVWCHIL